MKKHVKGEAAKRRSARLVAMAERRMRANVRELWEDGVNPVQLARALRASVKSDAKERAEAAAAPLSMEAGRNAQQS